MWQRLYDTKSGMEMGTLYQLRNLLSRRNVTTQPKSDVNANEDFLELVVTGYILTAVLIRLGMSNVHDMPPSVVSPDIWMEDDSVRQSTLMTLSSSVVESHTDLATKFHVPSPSHETASCGRVYDYTREVFSLGLLYLDFKDAIREGDGNRVMRDWKYFLPIFKATGHKNYALEALTLLSQYFVSLPTNLAAQIKWSRFVNVHGLPGRNISCDLHMEHMNRIVKTAIEGLGANKTEKAIIRIRKSVGTFMKTLEKFDREVGVPSVSGKHSKKSMLKDLEITIQQLVDSRAFDTSKSHTHKSFSSHKTNLMAKLKEQNFKDWIVDKIAEQTLS